jgi:folylpolyglutamate synthase/dihydrofolate synthase
MEKGADMPKTSYLTFMDQMYNTEWVLDKQRRIALLRHVIMQAFPDGYPAVLTQIGGTSGKGSCCVMLEQALLHQNIGAVGTSISPHLFSPAERIRINGKAADKQVIAAMWHEHVLPACAAVYDAHGLTLCWTSRWLLLALHVFAQHKCHVVVLETDVGGGYSPLMAVPVRVAGLTNVGHDHLRVLGKAPWQRALEKAQMVRHQGILITSETAPDMQAIMRSVCADRSAEFIYAPPVENQVFAHQHQRSNAGLVMAMLPYILDAFRPHVLVRAGLYAAMGQGALAGRMQPFGTRLWGDIAHSAPKVHTLVQQCQALFPDTPRVYVVALSHGRAAADVLMPLLADAAHIIATTLPDETQAATAQGQGKGMVPAGVLYDQLCAAAGDGISTPQIHQAERPEQALAKARDLAADQGVTIVTGSNFLLEHLFATDAYEQYLNSQFQWRG